MKEKYLKCLIVIVGILLLLFVSNKIMKPKSNELPEVKLKEIVNKNKSFAIMIQEKSETDKYQEYSSNKWPGDDYKFKEAKCIDNNGNEIKDAVTYEEGKITLTTNKTVYCTVYFDKSIIGKLREKDTQKYLSTDKQGGMYRYQAAFPDSDSSEMTNWICFGTTDNCGTNDDNIDKYMYRIIGITPEGQLYLIKETFLKEESSTGFKWNTQVNISNCLGDKCEWPNVDMYKRLNGEGRTISKTNLFIDSAYYDYLKSEDNAGVSGSDAASKWYKLIADHNWMYGDTNESKYNGDAMYGIETGNPATKMVWPNEEQGQTTCSDVSPCTEKGYTWSKDIPAKIGLMYLHDVAYAYANCSSGECSLRGNPSNAANVKSSWIHFQKDGYNTSQTYEWLLTRLGVQGTSATNVAARIVTDSGVLHSNYSLGTMIGARPVFYLKSSTKIADGSGTKTDPYIINL